MLNILNRKFLFAINVSYINNVKAAIQQFEAFNKWMLFKSVLRIQILIVEGFIFKSQVD